MRELPIGIQSFEILRRDGLLYVDKTARLLDLIEHGRIYFLSRPRRFGKSLTLSTLEAMFSGREELFSGLAAENWVKEQKEHPYPVVRFDMSALGDPATAEELNSAIIEELENIAEDKGVKICSSASCGRTLKNLIRELCRDRGSAVVLIDEYDKLILDNIGDLNKAEAMREVLRSFYTVLKSCDEYLRFVFITGISKFSKVGVFSAMNNLLDISLMEKYSDIVGYTQHELEKYFDEWISFTAEQRGKERTEILSCMKEYYDGFSFDGSTRLYNPYSILSYFRTGEFNNYWYESGSPSFIVEWMKERHIKEPDEYRHTVVKSDFLSSQEIEYASPASFLFQSGYLTIENKQEQLLTLDYPNREVLDSLSSMYLKLIYKVEGYALLGNEIWKALRKGDLKRIADLYNTALTGIPYDDYFKNRNEFWYRSLFVMLLRGAGIIAYSEPHTSKGCADIVIQFNKLTVVIEFKFAAKSSEVPLKKLEGEEQMKNRLYADNYAGEGRDVKTAVFVADDELRQIVF
ncbi:AAA family ATPase [bacterium]|nr:AAA family ATPase [bacterium]